MASQAESVNLRNFLGKSLTAVTGIVDPVIKVKIYAGIKEGFFQELKTYDVTYVENTSKLSEVVKIVDGIFFYPVAKKIHDEEQQANTDFEKWVDELNILSRSATPGDQTDTYLLVSSNLYPYFYYGDKWIFTNEKSPLYYDPMISTVKENLQEKPLELFYFNNSAELIYVNFDDESKRRTLTWKDILEPPNNINDERYEEI